MLQHIFNALVYICLVSSSNVRGKVGQGLCHAAMTKVMH